MGLIKNFFFKNFFFFSNIFFFFLILFFFFLLSFNFPKIKGLVLCKRPGTRLVRLGGLEKEWPETIGVFLFYHKIILYNYYVYFHIRLVLKNKKKFNLLLFFIV
ncbi:UNVERIFIED_CONTAM: hypothetical protein DVV43_11840 [Lactobacillus helveticus]|nr:hypothetical protein [Lactobacillus helveticus]